ncbi:hypothetical protein SEUCBS139899_002360 [Sporothrix eucalyptigena]|uniref:Uncharacterized protein n=1 Tax=Sporothrix eucalyptigena TaxID=1812306 RepID=A0ABP0B1Y7_9PEZI
MGANQSSTSSTASTTSTFSSSSSKPVPSYYQEFLDYKEKQQRLRQQEQRQQQILLQHESYKPPDADLDILGDSHGYFAAGYDDGECYVTYATAEVPGFYMSQSGCQAGAAGLSLSRKHAVRSAMSPTPRSGSRREVLLHSNSQPLSLPSSPSSLSSFLSSRSSSSRSSPRSTPSPRPPTPVASHPYLSSGLVSFQDLGVMAPTSPYPLMARPTTRMTSRFREQL